MSSPTSEQVTNALRHLRQTPCDGCNGAAEVINELLKRVKEQDDFILELLEAAGKELPPRKLIQ